MNPLRELNEYGQVVWMDFIRRDLLTDGELKRLVDVDGVTGVTVIRDLRASDRRLERVRRPDRGGSR